MGGEAHILEKKVRELENRFPKCQVVLAIDGYSHIDLFDLFEKINTAEVNLLIVAAGSPKQEEILNWFCSHGRYLNESIAILTCGGWLDQLLFSSYYPSWAYPLRLNWLVRMFRDPKRLWRRYLVAPFLFLLKKNCIEEYLLQASGYKNFRIRQLNLQNKL
jgi:exopolysaccharide biosynthesis WecB/TagA/CpsF family protein